MSPNTNKSISEILPLEIWQHVLDFLLWGSGKTLHSLNLTCREFNQIVSPKLFRILRILSPRQDVTAFHKTVARLKENVGEGVYPHVRVLVLSYAYYNLNASGIYHKRVDPVLIYGLVTKLHNLEIIRWTEHPIPPLLFQNLNTRLHAPVFNFYGTPNALTGNFSESAPCIKSLSIAYTISDRHRDINALGKVVLSLPNLERLILKHHPGHHDVVRPIFDLPSGSMLPPLQVLSFANFSFNPDQAAGWARCLRDQNLRDLRLDGNSELSELIRALGGCVSRLESFTIRISDGTAAATGPQIIELLDQFLQQIRELRAFSAYDVPKEVLSCGVLHHGNHLRRLRFRRTHFAFLQPPGQHGIFPWPRMPKSVDEFSTFSPDELTDLSSKLPILERLGIDLCLPEKVPYEYLDAFGALAHLKYLELNTPLREKMDPEPLDPRWYLRRPIYRDLMMSLVEESFRYVADRKELHHRTAKNRDNKAIWSQLVQMDVKAEEWEPFLKDYLSRHFVGNSIFSCWREDGVHSKLHTMHLRKGVLEAFVEDYEYEEAIYSAGFWDSAQTDIGPAVW